MNRPVVVPSFVRDMRTCFDYAVLNGQRIRAEEYVRLKEMQKTILREIKNDGGRKKK